MTIAYLPSEGGINKVGLTRDNLWFGDSIGGKIIDRIKVNKYSSTNSYYGFEYANLDSSSRWFFKDVTEYNFLNGITVYRCVYIGSDSRFGESELLGNIPASISHNGPSEADGSVEVDILLDGKYTSFTSQNTTILEDEQDSTGVISGRNDWASSITYNEVLKPGEYIKVWIRLRFSTGQNLAEISDYDYFITLKDLTIPMRRTNGRMPMSKIFGMSLNDVDNYILKETIPKEVSIDNIYKIIDNGKYLNILHLDNNDLKLLVVKTNDNVQACKYVEFDISTFVPGLTASNQFLSNFSQCYTTSITGVASSGTSGSPESVGPTGFPIDTPDISFDYNNVVGMKFLVDIHGTAKPDRNDFYLFFNTFLSDTSEEYVQRYGHRNYYWNCGVIHLNLNHINEEYFYNIDSGYENKKIINLIEQYEEILNDRFFISSVKFKDDLFSGVGYIPEDCRIISNNAKLFYLWEGDIINRNPTLQMFNVPAVASSEMNTIENIAGTEPYLSFNDNHVNLINFGFVRSLRDIDNNVKFIHMGPAAQRAFHHGLSPVSYDLPNTNLDEFSSTWSFGISEQSVSVIVPPTTGCNVDTVSSSAVDLPSDDSFDQNNPNHWHIQKQSHFDSFVSGDISVKGSEYKINIIDKLFSIFNIHCIGDPSLSVLKANYNFKFKEWNIIINDESGEPFTITVNDVPLFISAENTITVNMYRQLDYGCSKKFMTHIEIWVNGKQLFTGISYTRYTNDVFTISHNYSGDFSGWVSYWELKKYIETEFNKYAIQMFQLLSNIAWAELEPELENTTEVEETKMFSFKRNIMMRNLSWGANETLVIPVVLQGNGYNISNDYNYEVRRNVFDFKKIDINQKSFAFTLEGSSKPLEWISNEYDIERDMLVVWVRVENWHGQRITMYYSDNRIIQTRPNNRPYKDEWYAVWHMNNNIKISRRRFIKENIFHAGEGFVNVSDSNGNNYLIRIDKEYVFGYVNIYKSNNFDLEWDDRTADAKTTGLIGEFIKTNVPYFKPSFTDLRTVKSMFPYKTESGGNNFEVRNRQPNDSNIVVKRGPNVVCRY